MKNIKENITKDIADLYKKDVDQIYSSFELEVKHKNRTIDKLNADLNAIYSSKAWKLITKYRELKVKIKPKKDIKNEIDKNNYIYPKKGNKPLIAYIIPGCEISGGVAVVCQHVNRLKKRGYNCILITEDQNDCIDWFPNQEVEIYKVVDSPINIDVLVATSWTTAYTLEKIKAKKKFYFVQSDETRFFDDGDKRKQLAKKTYEMDVEFLTEAKWIQRWLKNNFNKNAYYVPNGIDTNFMYPTMDRYIERKTKRILLEGAIDIPYKGMEDAFKAVDGLDCEVWCVSSSGKPKPEWKCDKFFSRVPIQKMNFIYSQCDILLKMSRVEGFFGPPMEMMACKGACVVGKVSGYDEYIVDGYNALVIEQGNIVDAHNSLKKLLEDNNLRNNLSENGYITATKWEWTYSIDLLEKIYNEKQINK